MFWNEAWLKPVDEKSSRAIKVSADDATGFQHPQNGTSTEGLLQRLRSRQGDRYYCQSTELGRISGYLSSWNFTHFLLELRHGEVSFGDLVRIVVRTLINRMRAKFGARELHGLTGPDTSRSKGDLDLQAGEWIEVKPPAEIEQTLNAQSRNRGLLFETDMLAFAGRRFRVAAPVRRIILEETGKMIELTNTVVLEGVTCKGLCSKNCLRANPLFWREAWLSRPNTASSEQTSPSAPCAGAAFDRGRELRIAPATA